MKKLLMLAALACSGMAAHALDEGEMYLDRTGWNAHACSVSPKSGGEGPISFILDDNLSTYWHSQWTSGDVDAGTTQTHWFTIDLGTSMTFHGFDYWGRPSGSNGRILKGKIYTSNEPFADFGVADSTDKIAAAKAYYDNAENVATKEFTFSYEENGAGVRECRFDEVKARYVLILTDETTGGFCSCAEFKLVGNASDLVFTADLNPSNWTVEACSSISDGGSGQPESMFDGDLSTYWHQNYNNDASATSTHWFKIDLKESQDIDGFKYWRRQNNTNGRFISGKVYVSDTDFDSFANDAAARTYCNNTENQPAAQFTFNYDSNSQGVRVCEFEQTQHGRYVLVIISDSGADRNGRHACCAEFKLYKDLNAEMKAKWYNGIRDAKAKAESYRNMSHLITNGLPSTARPAAVVTDAAIAAKNAELQNYTTAFNGKQILIQCAYRRSKGYLTAIPTGDGVKFNTLTSVTPDAVWEILNVDGGFRLYNRTTGYYIGTDNTPKAAANQAQTFAPKVINTDYVAFEKGTSGELLHADGNGSNLMNWWEAQDEGSSWVVSLANSDNYNFAEPETSTAEAPKYYRIVNARWMYSHNSPCMAVNGENQGGSGNGETSDRATAAVPGIYWRLEAADENGGVKLVNLTGYEFTYSGGSNATMSESGSTLYAVPAEGSQFNGIKVYGLSNASDIGDDSCFDASANNGQIRVCWSPTRQQAVGNGDNGSAWYFILAGDAEIAAATQAYIAGVKSYVPVDESLAGLFGAQYYNKEIAPKYESEETVADVNRLKGKIPEIHDAVVAKISTLTKRHFRLHNKNANYANCYMAVVEVDGSNGTVPSADATDLNTVWQFIAEGDGYLINSVGNGGFLYYTTAGNKPIPVQEEGAPYSIDYDATVPGFSFRLCPNETVTNVDQFVIHQSNNSSICKWYADHIPGSHWMLELLDDIQMTVSLNGDNHTLQLGEGVTLNTHDSAADHQLVITKLAEELPQASADMLLYDVIEPNNGVYTLNASHFTSDGSADLSKLPEGSYSVEAPAGMFLVNGKAAAAVSRTLKVASNGVVTGIGEVTLDAPAVEGIYDLQGRKLAAPVKGINIINGKKVLVK